MATDITSPFTPGRPVPLDFFVGRSSEIERLRRKTRDAVQANRVEVAFVTGERGIGKSSLAAFARFLAERDTEMIGVHALLGGIDTVEGAVKRVLDQLLKQNAAHGPSDKLISLFGKHVKSVGLFGTSIEFSATESELKGIADNFGESLREILKKMEKPGFLLVLDDINGLADSGTFADWFKSLVDEISVSREPFPLSIVLVGLEERRRSMIERQPSVARIFDVVEIRPWSSEETAQFFVNTFESIGIRCEADALNEMTKYAGGLPVLAQEIGDAAFAQDNDRAIDLQDAMSAAVIAADRVGSRYLDAMVYRSMRSQRYREILRRMARGLSQREFTRSEVRAALPDAEQNVFDNFLGKMKKLGVIVEDPERGRGAYRFGSSLHYLYFFLEAIRAEKVDP